MLVARQTQSTRLESCLSLAQTLETGTTLENDPRRGQRWQIDSGDVEEM